MRARVLRPGFFSNAALAQCSYPARILFAGLWCLADREGRLEDRPEHIRGELFRFDATVDVNAALHELRKAGFVLRYRVGAVHVIQVCNFLTHQNPHPRETESKLPAASEAKKVRPGNGKARPGSAKKLQGVAQPGVFVPVSVPVSVPTPGAPAPDPAPPRPQVCASEAPKPDPKPEASLEGVVCIALKRAGIAAVNPSHPTLHALVAAGATVDEFADAAKAATGKRDPFAYVLAVVQGRREQALQVAHAVQAPPPDPNAWMETQAGVIVRGGNLGLDWDRGAEEFHAFRRRVIAAHNAGVQQHERHTA